MTLQRATLAATSPRLAMSWWYTLAHEETPPARLAVRATDLDALAASLAERGQAAPATLVGRMGREVARAEVERRARDPYGQAEAAMDAGGECYVWAFRRLGDALMALRAIRRSDYHPYPHPTNLREDSLNRLFQRFPLVDFPRATALLFTGARVCDDPRIGADPRAERLAMEAPATLAPEEWARYTLCGFREGVALARVDAAAHWLRIGPRTLEDTWAAAREQCTPHAERIGEERLLLLAEERARETLLRIAPADKEPRPYEVATALSQAPTPDEPAPARSRRPRRPTGARRPRYTVRPPAV